MSFGMWVFSVALNRVCVCVCVCVCVVDCLGSYKGSKEPSRGIPQTTKNGFMSARPREVALASHPSEDTSVTTLTEASTGPQRGGVGEQPLDPTATLM